MEEIVICKVIDSFQILTNLKSSCFYNREVIGMEEKKITEDSGNVEEEKKEVSNPDPGMLLCCGSMWVLCRPMRLLRKPLPLLLILAEF
jgi:hypothetical protein